MRRRHVLRTAGAAGAVALALVLGCGDERSASPGAASTAAAVASGGGSAPTPLGAGGAGPGAAGPGAAGAGAPLGALVRDPALVPSGPSDKGWYFREDDPATPDNEAARDLAQAIAAAGNGLAEAQVYDHLTRGGPLAIFVGGAGYERDTAGHRSGWLLAYAPHVQAGLGVPALQVDYQDWASRHGGVLPPTGPLTGPLELAAYHASFGEGVLRTLGLLGKALSAGSRDVRLIGHSKGGDVVQEVAWLRRAEPRLTCALAFGVPVWCAANPDPDPALGRGGLFRPGPLRGRDWQGKLVLFNRASDRSVHGEFFPVSTFPGPGHDYSLVLADPALRDLLDRACAQWAVGQEDRGAGRRFDVP